MRTRQFFERGARVIGATFRDSLTASEELSQLVGDACRDAHARGGWPRLVYQGFCEWNNLLWVSLAKRLGDEPAITVDRSRRTLLGALPRWRPRGGPMLNDDVRHAFRRLRGQPGTTAAAVAMLALGIGITTAMFTVVDALIWRPVPFRDPDRLARIYMGNERGGRGTVQPAVLNAWRGSPAFEAAEAANSGVSLIDTDTGVTTRPSARVTPGLLRMLGVLPMRGRLFDDGEGRAGAEDRVLISEDVWQTMFDGDRNIIGRRIRIDGESASIVGVLPAEFRFPSWNTVIWRPINHDAPPAALANELPIPFVRFAAGIPQADALRIATEAAHSADGKTLKLRAIARPMAGFSVDPYYARAVPLLAGGVVLVFLILCANVSSLLLTRLTARRREFSMCSALGASRFRLLRQAFMESLSMGVVGAVAGVGLAWVLVSVARTFLPEAFLLRSLNPVNIDLRALAAASGFGILATLAVGVLPAWIGTRLEAGSSLRAIERSGTEARAARVVTRVLLIGEIGLACTLLVGATLLVRSFINLAAADRGLETDGIITAWVSLPASTFSTREARVVVASRMSDEVKSLPGVQRVAWSFGTPPDGGGFSWGEWRSDVPGSAAIDMTIDHYQVGPDFFEIYGIPLLKGRTFEPQDTDSDVIIGERLAALFWPSEEPVGRSFTWPRGKQLRVIGVARETHYPNLDSRLNRPEFYLPFIEGGENPFLNIQCAGACPDPAVIRQRLVGIHPAVRVHDVGPVSDAYLESLARPRAAAALGFAFAAIAVIAAAGGLFSVLSYAVGRRRREFGIRTALGATPGQIQRLVLGDGLVVAVIGIVIGAGAAWLLGRALASLQYGVTAADPISWTIVLGLLGCTTLAASWRPARQAMRVDPVSLLREE